MATSGSYDYTLTGTTFANIVAENLGVLAAGETLSSDDQTLILARLNLVAKSLSGNIDLSAGLPVMTRQRVTLFMAEGQQTYLVGPASTDARASTAYGRTTIDAAEAIGQTVISVAATTDTATNPGTTVTMTASDIIGVEQDDGTIFWSTISSVAAGDTVTIGTGLDVAAAVGNYVWWFTSRAQRFVEVEAAVLRDENRNDTRLEVYRTVQEYDEGVVDKYADGDPTAILVEPLRIATRVTLNSQPTDVTKQIVLTVFYPQEDYDAAANDIAFPQEYLDYLTWQVALRCVPAFGAEWTPAMQANLTQAMTFAKNLNPEVSNAYFQPGGL